MTESVETADARITEQVSGEYYASSVQVGRVAVPDSKKSKKPAASKEPAGPSLRTVLKAYQDLMQAGKLHFVGQDQWNMEVAEIKRKTAKLKRPIRQNLKRPTPG
jgi:hypothetical protein